MKKLKTVKLEVKTQTIRSLTDQQLNGVVGGAVNTSLNCPSNNMTARCQTYQV